MAGRAAAEGQAELASSLPFVPPMPLAQMPQEIQTKLNSKTQRQK